MEAELKALESALGNPIKPVTAVVGGAKVSSKLDVLKHLVGQVDHLITPVVEHINTDDRVLVIAGGIEGISCWGDILANAALAKQVRGTIIDGCSRDIDGSAAIGYPVYGRGVTMISARNRVMQIAAAVTIEVAGVNVSEDDYVIADNCGTVFVPQAHIAQVVDLGERIARRQQVMLDAVRSGRSVAEVMHDSQFEAIRTEHV